nr:unnamed protein product [Digitaria exilis]
MTPTVAPDLAEESWTHVVSPGALVPDPTVPGFPVSDCDVMPPMHLGIRPGPRIAAAYPAADGNRPAIEYDVMRRSGSGFDLAIVRAVNALIHRLVARAHIGCAQSRCVVVRPHDTAACHPAALIQRDNGVAGHSPRCSSLLPSPYSVRSSSSSPPKFSTSPPLKLTTIIMLRPWAHSSASIPALESLVSRGLLCPRASNEEWISPPPTHKTPSRSERYVVSFMAYHVRGFSTPAHRFIRDVLHHFGVELHALAPSGVQQMANFCIRAPKRTRFPPFWM